MTFGEKLKMLRKSRFMTQQKLADELGVGQSSIASYENDTREPDFATIQRIAKYFGVSFTSMLPNKQDADNDLVLQVANSMHDNPKIRMLFDRSRFLTESDLDAVLAVVCAIAKEREHDE